MEAGSTASKKARRESSFAAELAEEQAASASAGKVQKQQWARDPFPPPNPAEDSVCLQWTDIDMYVGKPLKVSPNKDGQVWGSRVGPVPIVRIYGVTEAGNSVVLHVHGFTPYFYCLPPNREFTQDRDAEGFRAALEGL